MEARSKKTFYHYASPLQDAIDCVALARVRGNVKFRLYLIQHGMGEPPVFEPEFDNSDEVFEDLLRAADGSDNHGEIWPEPFF